MEQTEDIQVKFLDLKAHHEPIQEEIFQRLKENVFFDTSFVRGKSVTNFENNFAQYIGTNHCVGVGNGTDALEIALQALDIGPGDEVITQANTFISTVFAIKSVGAKPVLVDCDENFMIDASQIESKITSNTKCIIPVHLYGHPANMDKIMELAKKNSLYVVEDAAQAHGAKYKGKCVGSFGNIGCFSFYPGKNLGACGDGGALVTNDAVLCEKIRKISNLGSAVKYHHEITGRNSRLDSIQAEILDIKLKYLEFNNEKRRNNAKLYDEQLSKIPGIKLQKVANDCSSVYHLYVIRVENRDKFRECLKNNGIETGIHYPIPVHKTNVFLDEFREETYPNTEKYAKEMISLPMYPELTLELISHVNDTIKKYFTIPKSIITFDLCTISFFGGFPIRKELTEKYCKYVKYLQKELLQENIKLSFTMVASDGKESFSMFKKYFGDDKMNTYVEFKQKNKYRKEKYFWAMLQKKTILCHKKSFEKLCDITAFIGSNDFYSKEYFIQVAKKYDSSKKQIFGLVASDVQNNINNAVVACVTENKDGIITINENAISTIQHMYGNPRTKLPNKKKHKRRYIGNAISYGKTLFTDGKYAKFLFTNAQVVNEISVEAISGWYGAILEGVNNIAYLNIKSDIDITKMHVIRDISDQKLPEESFNNKKLTDNYKRDIRLFNCDYQYPVIPLSTVADHHTKTLPLPKNKKITVIFLFVSLRTFRGFENLYNHISKNHKHTIHPVMIVTKNIDRRQKKINYNNVKNKLIEKKIKFLEYTKNLKLRDYNPHFIMLNVPYPGHYPSSLMRDVWKLQESGCKICHSSYGYNVWGHYFFLSIAPQGKMDILFSENSISHKEYKTHLKQKNANTVVYETGCPKIQNINNEEINITKNQILWCPRYGTGSTFNMHNKFMVDFASKNNQINILCRFHQLDNQNNKETFYDLISSIDNINLDKDDDYFDQFKNSDVLVSDLSSLIAEFFYTGKPVIYTYHVESHHNKFFEALSSGIYTVCNTEELNERLHDLMVNKNDPLKLIRKKLIKKYYEIYNPCENICKVFMSSLNN